MAQSKLDQTATYQMTSNHALSVSLMYDAENQYNPYFIFLNLAPGNTGQDGRRSFDFQNTISLKIGLDKLSELRYALQAYARGQQAVTGDFTIFVDGTKSTYNNGTGVKKSAKLNWIAGDPQSQWNKGPTVSFSFKSGDNKANAFMMSPVAALTLAEICGKLFDKGLDLHMNKNAVSFKKPEKSNYRPAQPGPQQGSLEQAANTAAGMGDDPFGNN